jgi:hypothetical protein
MTRPAKPKKGGSESSGTDGPSDGAPTAKRLRASPNLLGEPGRCTADLALRRFSHHWEEVPKIRGRTAREAIIDAARKRLVAAARELRPGRERSLRLIQFKVRCAQLLLRLAEGA